MAMSHEMMDGSSDHDGPFQELPSRCALVSHDSCPASPGDEPCNLMSACAVAAVLAEQAAPPKLHLTATATFLVAQHELRRPTAPEPPPPRA